MSVDRQSSSPGALVSLTGALKSLIALLGLLPSAALLTGMIEIPESLDRLVKLVTLPVSVVAIVTIVVHGATIQRWSPNRAMAVFGACALLCVATAATYYIVAQRHVFEYRGERMVAPLNPSDETRDIIRPWSNRYDQALDNSPRSDRLEELLRSERIPAQIVMFLLMLSCQLLLVVSMVGSAWKLALQSEDRFVRPGEIS